MELICDAKNGLLQAEAVDAGKTHTSILFELAQQQRWIDPTWGEFSSIGVYAYPCHMSCLLPTSMSHVMSTAYLYARASV